METMAGRKKTSTFFIRATTNLQDDNNFYFSEIDLGAFVNVLDKAVLKILAIEAAMSDSAGRITGITDNSAAQWQLTTQEQSDNVLISDKSLIASGMYVTGAVDNNFPQNGAQWMDTGPQTWSDGYLVATESIYLGGSATSTFTEDVYVSVILECQVMTMDIQDGVALALSQQ